MKKINLETAKAVFDNGVYKWYIEPKLQKYIEREQADNLPPLTGMGVFIVLGEDADDLVLIDYKQNVIASFHNTMEGYGQMEARINIIKIDKHFKSCTKN